MNLKHLIALENKERDKKKKMIGHVRYTRSPPEKVPKGQKWNNLTNKIKHNSI